jgi:hypothetical protein
MNNHPFLGDFGYLFGSQTDFSSKIRNWFFDNFRPGEEVVVEEVERLELQFGH